MNEMQVIKDKRHYLRDQSQEESLEKYKYLTSKIDKIYDAFKKNISGKLTDEELNEVLKY